MVYSAQRHIPSCIIYKSLKFFKPDSVRPAPAAALRYPEEYKFQILAMEVMPDHIHLLVNCKPQFNRMTA